MRTRALDQVLACPNLPTLPGVAMEVLELTRQPDIALRTIASAVQNDQALTSKILRTINSSFYGLSKPVATIDRALAFLGVNTVKSLVLGFSLVDALDADEQFNDTAFDLIRHWRRAVYGGSGARLLASRTGAADPEEAFVAAMLLEVGKLAAFTALRDDYLRALEGVPDEPKAICDAEQEAFGFDHVNLGAALAEKWKLPDAQVGAIRNWRSPDLASGEAQSLARVCSLSVTAVRALDLEGDERAATLESLLKDAYRWFRFDRELVEAFLTELVADADQLSKLFKVDTGERPDVGNLLADAQDQFMQHQLELERRRSELQHANRELTNANITDPLTGAYNRRHFDATIRDTFSGETTDDVAVLFIDADKFKSVNDDHGHAAGDAVLVQLAERLKTTAAEQAQTFRYGGEEFALIAPGLATTPAAELGERIRDAVASTPFDLSAVDCKPDELTVTVSIGVAARDQHSTQRFDCPDALVTAADKQVYRAKQEGRNRVCTDEPNTNHTAAPADHPTAAAAPPETDAGAPATPTRPKSEAAISILLIEDDKLQAKLYQAPLSKLNDVQIRWAEDGERAIALLKGLAGEPPFRPDLILCDLGLPGMPGEEVVQALKQDDDLCTIPVVVLTASDDDDAAKRCLRAGANAFIPKSRLGDDPRRRILQITQFWCIARAA